jgi:hypothetical protein
MKKITLLSIAISFVLTACNQSGPAPAAGPSTSVPTNIAPIDAPTIKADTPTLPATSASTTTPIGAKATDAPTVPPVTPTKVRPRPTATSSGPVTVEIYVANCQSAPTAEKPGGITIEISIEAKGGNGVYEYFDNEGVQHSSKFIDISWAKGSALIGKVTVTSGDGQTVEKEYFISPAEAKCP